MPNGGVLDELRRKFSGRFGTAPVVGAYAPGRVEVLGNHTDYNEGFVLSAAIDRGTFFLAAPSGTSECRLVAGDVMEEVRFDAASPKPSDNHCWSNYVKGVFAGIAKRARPAHGFMGMFLGNIPLGSGLSSSAALSMSSGLALGGLYGAMVSAEDMARIGQAAEHEFAGVKCGLLDQISSLFGKAHRLVLTDFRSLDVDTVPLGDHACFLLCDTKVKHSLVASEYNERRASCEKAARFFAGVLDHPVTHLRDVSWAEWERHHAAMDPTAAKRSAHVIGENKRVSEGCRFLRNGDLKGFGALMFESHESSRVQFENSCEELDFVVETARRTRGVLGARLSGGGFGGSAVILADPADTGRIGKALAEAYSRRFGHPCETRVVVPSDGARLMPA